jgi:hypothetical protein
MPRRKGFCQEDYDLALAVDKLHGLPDGSTVPSKACDIAEKWALVKMRKRAKIMYDAGYHDHAVAIYNTCALLEDGTL